MRIRWQQNVMILKISDKIKILDQIKVHPDICCPNNHTDHIKANIINIDHHKYQIDQILELLNGMMERICLFL